MWQPLYLYLGGGGGEVTNVFYIVKVKIALHKIKQTRRTLFKTIAIRERD